jgi:hypothetical protein
MQRRAVTALLTDPEWSQWSDHEIARKCRVSQPLVGRVRREVRPATKNIISREPRKGIDGRTMDTSNIGRKPAPRHEDTSIATMDEPAYAQIDQLVYLHLLAHNIPSEVEPTCPPPSHVATLQ